MPRLIQLDALEEVDYMKDLRYRTLRQGDKPEELAWFSDAIVSELEKNGLYGELGST